MDFPGGTHTKNPTANAGDKGSILVWEDPTCQGTTKPASLNSWEPVCCTYWSPYASPVSLEPTLHNQRNHCSEKPVHRDEEKPPTAPTRESLLSATKTQRSQTNKKQCTSVLSVKNIIVHPHNTYETTEKEEVLTWMCWDEKMSMILI